MVSLDPNSKKASRSHGNGRHKRGFRVCLLIIGFLILTLALSSRGFISYRSPLVFGLANAYGRLASEWAVPRPVNSGYLRAGVIDEGELARLGSSWQAVQLEEGSRSSEKGSIRIASITPNARDYARLAANCSQQGVKLVVQCSGMDAWHTTPRGWRALEELRNSTLRVVIFDGGHHLPTLALQPDLVIIPATMGYAAHGYMKDALSVKCLAKILKQENLSFPVVTVPRWALVKTEDSMNKIAIKAVNGLCLAEEVRPLGRALAPHLTTYGSAAYLYVAEKETQDLQKVKGLLDEDVSRVYMAFNYNSFTWQEAQRFKDHLAASGLQVEVVNEPLNFAGVLRQRGIRCILGHQESS